ncbi:MAG: OmpA family protein [Crocinitomicaceae bacterium]|nr:OmpA family protein [Crocinitomicaceae bacterium]
MNKLKTLLLLLIFPMVSIAQLTEAEVRDMVNNASEQELVIQSSTMMQQNYYFLAEIIVDKLLTIKPESANYNYRKGFLIMGSRSDYIAAKPYLLKATENTDKNFDAFSVREESAPLDVYYHLGMCYHLDEDLDEARKNYSLLIENSPKGSELVSLAKLKLQQCDVAEYLIENPKTAVVENIGNIVNTGFAEYSPVVSLDGTSLYFTSRRNWEDGSTDEFRDPMLNNHPEDIYVSYQDFEGEWTSPEKLAFCRGELNEATIAVSSDERRIYVYNDGKGGGDIFFSEFGENKFEEIEELRVEGVNTDAWETHITVTPDGENMYFVSNREGGFGGRDIYRVVKLPNGDWSAPQNMGPEINTPYDEDSPFIAINNKTLYYSSNGPQSMGGFDVFVSFRDEDNSWSDPVNMGYPINSTGDDIFYTTTIDGLKGYLSSFRKGGYGEKDIYEIRNDYLGNRPISSLKGLITTISGDPISETVLVKLLCSNCENEDKKITYPRMKNGKFFAVLDRCKDYVLEFYDGDQVIRSESFTTLCNAQNEEINKNHVIGGYSLIGTIADIQTTEYIPGSTVEFLNPEDESVVASYTTDENGAFISDLLEGKKQGDEINYYVRVSKDGYLTQTFEAKFTLENEPVIKLEYLINKTEVGIDLVDVFEINPIYFDLDKSNIRPDAAIELDKIVKIMNENPDIKIELGSHTDCRATASYNMRLSTRRANSSADYIQARIDDPSRIYGRGYGETQLVNDCNCEGDVVSDCSDEEHQENRRTEFTIVK